MKKYLECGTVSNTHGIAGAVKVYSLCDSPEVLADLPVVYVHKLGVYRELKVTSSSVYKQTVIFTFEGVDDVDKAARLKNCTLYADRDDFGLPDGTFFLADLIGLPVIDADNGKTYGKVSGVNTNSAQLLYEVETENGIKLLPAVDAFIKEIVPEKCIYVTPVPGLFDDLA